MVGMDASRSVALWTVQDAGVAARMSGGGTYWAQWSAVEPTWVDAYGWMTQQLAQHTGTPGSAPPVWCWAQPYDAGQVESLASENQIQRGLSIVMLRVPADLVLWSSYTRWCDVLYGETAADPAVTLLPSLAHDGDVWQACVPFVSADWVDSVTAYDATVW